MGGRQRGQARPAALPGALPSTPLLLTPWCALPTGSPRSPPLWELTRTLCPPSCPGPSPPCRNGPGRGLDHEVGFLSLTFYTNRGCHFAPHFASSLKGSSPPRLQGCREGWK